MFSVLLKNSVASVHRLRDRMFVTIRAILQGEAQQRHRLCLSILFKPLS
jgi:hypothetical protein